MMLTPGSTAPSLDLALLGGGRWRLADQPSSLTMIAFYRGSFCRFCRQFLRELDGLANEFATRDIGLLAASSDDAGEAEDLLAENGIDALPIAHGLSGNDISAWGLFASRAERDGRERLFAEPALILTKSDGSVYAVFQNSMSCARPDLQSLIEGLDLLRAHGYPIRGNA